MRACGVGFRYWYSNAALGPWRVLQCRALALSPRVDISGAECFLCYH